jgi:hypothetical protein
MKLVKILVSDDGEKQDAPKWHLVQNFGDSPRTVCPGEVFGMGEGSAVFKEKNTGKITCHQCIEIVKWFKDIKL